MIVAPLYALAIAVATSSAAHAIDVSSGVADQGGQVVISQVYGAGGTSSATFRNDFVEIFNRSDVAIPLDGLSVQYASPTGTGTFRATALSGSLEPGQYYLVQFDSSGTIGSPLPQPDATGVTNLGASGGKIALVNSSADLPCNGGSDPCSPAEAALILDLVGYGNANFFEGTLPAVPPPTASRAILRAVDGCQDTNDNRNDFAAAVPTPRNTQAPLRPCTFEISCPASIVTVEGTPVAEVLTARDGSGIVTAASIVSTPVPGIDLSGFTAATEVGGSASVTLNIGADVEVGSYPVEVEFASDVPGRTARCAVGVTVTGTQPGPARIHDIQGSAHRSPLESRIVTNVPGVVTASGTNGFILQDPAPDADPATSEGIFVFTGSTPPFVSVGAALLVSGAVTEVRPDGEETNLTTTTLIASRIILLSLGNPLPAPALIGRDGRLPPSEVVDAGGCGDVELAGCAFDAANDGIDFYESLEGMRVQVDNAVVVGPTSPAGEIAVAGDFGQEATSRTFRGGLRVAVGDVNPERVILDDALLGAALPAVNVSDGLGSVVGIMDYGAGDFRLQVTAPLAVTPNSPLPESTGAQQASELAIAAFNVGGLHATSPAETFEALARQIVENLQSPDILALAEIQDNTGPTDDGAVDAGQTLAALVSAIATAGGPIYHFRSIDPLNNQDGGEAGANIRQVFLFNPDRVTFIDRPGGGATVPTEVVNADGAAQLSASPGRIDPANPAFTGSRKPLAAEFRFNGHYLIVVANHFKSKDDDSPLLGRYQPPLTPSDAQRQQQGAVVSAFVKSALAIDPNANVVVLGDFNDFEFSSTLSLLRATPLADLGEQLPAEDRYGVVIEGNSQALDHVLASGALAGGAAYDAVHVNADYTQGASDHDPVVARFYLPAIEVTGQTTSLLRGLVLVRSTQLFAGSIQLTNSSATPIEGPVHVVLAGLDPQIELVNASGMTMGWPYVTYPADLAPGESVTVPLEFSNPLRLPVSYMVRAYSGAF
jgi:hypothetical protein